jgi:hypothetical protein
MTNGHFNNRIIKVQKPRRGFRIVKTYHKINIEILVEDS